MTEHPYSIGEKVWVLLDNRREAAAVSSVSWENDRPKIHIKLAVDLEAERTFGVTAGSYKWNAHSKRITPVSAIDLLGELAEERQ